MPKKVNGPDDRYTKLSTESKQRIIASSFGEVGTLKTTFWLTAPAPIAIQSADQGLEGVVDVYLKKLYEETGVLKEIYVINYDPAVGVMAQEEAAEIATKFEEDFAHILTWARTAVWDKETQVYEIFKYAQFGAPSDKPANYYALDQRYRHLINSAKETDINFGLIQAMKTPWVKKVNNKTGVEGAAPGGGRERRGMREIEELVHINIEHAIEGGEFVMRVGKSRGPGGREVQNTTVPYMDFPDFATLIFPETDRSNWE